MTNALSDHGRMTGRDEAPATLFTKKNYLAFWCPRMGREAAELSWRAGQERLYSFVCSWIGGGCIAGLIRTDFGLWWIGVGIAFALAVWFNIAGIRDLRASNRVMSEFFGFKIGFRADPGPPKLRAHYEKWCRAHGVAPFAADGQRRVLSSEAGGVDPPPVTAIEPGA